MEQQYDWLLDLAKISTEPKLPAARDGTESQAPKAGKSSQRSPAHILAQLPFLKDLHHLQIGKILKCSRVTSYRPGEQVCEIGTPSDEMYILISGKLAVLTKDGSQVLSISPVTTVGELGFITNCQRPVGLEATMDSKVVRISRSHFEQLLKSDSDMQTRVHRNIIDILSKKLIGLRERVEGALSRCLDPEEGS